MGVKIYSNKRYGRLLNDNNGIGWDYVLTKDDKVVYRLADIHRNAYPPRGVPLKDYGYLYVEMIPMKKIRTQNGGIGYVSCRNKYTFNTLSKLIDSGAVIFRDKHYRHMNRRRQHSTPYYAYYSSIEN